MDTIQVDFSKITGKMKPMHSVNNGPITSRGITNAPLFEEAGIPYARTHDASFCAEYGGSHTVDIPNIFPNFDADPDDPDSYDFVLTDEYLNHICSVKTKVFYRLGVKIEHEIKKYGIFPPKDFHKWAVICEHVIRHYTESWNNGFQMDIEYWEIWNEPDLYGRCWQGTDEQFFELYEISATYLKEKFPHLKIGGPAITSANNIQYFENFMKWMTKDGKKVPLDFFSWHGYFCDPNLYGKMADIVEDTLNKYGYDKTESILNEWNYIKAWGLGEIMKYNYKTMKNLKGSAFVAATMCVSQKSFIDHLMYYDARPCTFNGLFDSDTMEPLKPFYPFLMFHQLYQLKNEVESSKSCDNLFVCAASDDSSGAMMITYFDDNDSAQAKELKLEINGFHSENGIKIEYFSLDHDHIMDLIKEEIYTSNVFLPVITMNLNTTLFLKLSKIK